MVLSGLSQGPVPAGCLLAARGPAPSLLPLGVMSECLPHHAVPPARRHAEAVVPQLHLLRAIDLGEQHIARPLCQDVLLIHDARDAHKVAGIPLGQRDLVACRAGGALGLLQRSFWEQDIDACRAR